ncbi:MAG: DinB family protein [Ferruginibacter sp.]
MPKPIEGTYPAYFQNYINQVPEEDVMTAVENQQNVIDTFFDSISEEKSTYSYAEGKWSLKELLQHVIDTERIFIFRSLAFARKETQSLPGFDEGVYAAHSNANARTWKSLCEELKAVRKTAQLLFESFTDEMFSSTGLANNNTTTVNAMGFILVGHVYHHKNIIESRYL